MATSVIEFILIATYALSCVLWYARVTVELYPCYITLRFYCYASLHSCVNIYHNVWATGNMIYKANYRFLLLNDYNTPYWLVGGHTVRRGAYNLYLASGPLGSSYSSRIYKVSVFSFDLYFVFCFGSFVFRRLLGCIRQFYSPLRSWRPEVSGSMGSSSCSTKPTVIRPSGRPLSIQSEEKGSIVQVFPFPSVRRSVTEC